MLASAGGLRLTPRRHDLLARRETRDLRNGKEPICGGLK